MKERALTRMSSYIRRNNKAERTDMHRIEGSVWKEATNIPGPGKTTSNSLRIVFGSNSALATKLGKYSELSATSYGLELFWNVRLSGLEWSSRSKNYTNISTPTGTSMEQALSSCDTPVPISIPKSISQSRRSESFFKF